MLSLEKYREVVISGTIPKSEPDVPITVVGENAKSFILQWKSDLKFVSNDVKPSTRFKRKANSTEGGKWKVVCCHWNSDSIIHSSSLWCNGKKLINFSARGISCNNYVWGNFSKQDGDDFHEGLTSDCHTLFVSKKLLWRKNKSGHASTSSCEGTTFLPILLYETMKHAYMCKDFEFLKWFC